MNIPTGALPVQTQEPTQAQAISPADGSADTQLELLSPDADAFSPHEDWPARIARWCVQAIVVGLIAMMGVEMLVRSVFGWSIQISNEIGGYALIAVTFLSMASGQLQHAYHRVHLVDQRLGPVGQARLRLLFNLAATVVTLVMVAELVRFEWRTYASGDVAATSLMTPLWLPRLAMPTGMALLAWALLRTVAGDWRRLRAASHTRAA